MVPFTFFACAKNVTKKAQPILMRDFSSLRHYQTKIGVKELDFIEHFALNNKQDGMNCSCVHAMPTGLPNELCESFSWKTSNPFAKRLLLISKFLQESLSK